ncbi:GTPase ObgE [Candidatus Parcubacteria bacterium]|nr:GTPase ObgE [Candidatus Parcubacteria bacterium]
MIVDEIRIQIKGGKGGDGLVAFSKIKNEKGPKGGDGGHGGNVYVEGVSNLSALNKFRHKKEFFAGDGVDGKTRLLEGARGEELILKVPVGTIAHNLDSERDFEVMEVGEKILLAKGGRRGRGNWHFRSSTNTTPMECEDGKEGQLFNFFLELKMIADVGFIGLPSAGKSSLLNALTKANAKTAAYHFTTLEPNLGDYYGMILADIPGLIEGASLGKGLGMKFLRHIKRTKILIHCISSESLNQKKDYQIIKNELKEYETAIAQKKEYIFLTKTDLIDEKEVTKRVRELKKISPNVIPVSIYDENSLDEVRKILNKIKDKR